MTVVLDDLRAAIRARAELVVDLAGQAIVAQLYDAAGPGLPDGAVLTAIEVEPTIVTLRISVPDDMITQTVWTWRTGEPGQPFHPHQRLDGTVFSEADWRDVLANTEGWPGGPYFYPGDHAGCQCTVDNVVGDLVFDPAALDAQPFVIAAFGAQVLVTPPAPERTTEAPTWWTATLTPEAWQRALGDALAATA